MRDSIVWDVLWVSGVTVTWWFALFVCVWLVARSRSTRRGGHGVARPSQTPPVPPVDAAMTRHGDELVSVSFTESFNPMLVLAVMLGPPLAFVLMRVLS